LAGQSAENRQFLKELARMAIVAAVEAKVRFGSLLERVAQGEDIVITRYEKPVARLVPVRSHNLVDRRVAVSAVRNVRDRIARRIGPGKKLTHKEIRSSIAAGRR
jgi:prevent-host-death family protein